MSSNSSSRGRLTVLSYSTKRHLAQKLLAEAKEGQVPTVNVYDKNVRPAQKKPELVLERKQDKEQSLEQAR